MRKMKEKLTQAPLTAEKSVVYDAPVDVGSEKRVRCKEAGSWEMR